jgi:hypothetical protein
MAAIRTFRDLMVWQKAMDVAVEVCRLTLSFPKEELFSKFYEQFVTLPLCRFAA